MCALYRPLIFVRHLIEKHVKKGQTIVDATIGNGHDTLLLASRLQNTGMLYGFDIQQQALQITTKKLTLQNYTQYKLFHQSHTTLYPTLKQRIHSIDFTIFNLGYLPHGHDLTRTTTTQSTYSAIIQALTLTRKNGIVVLVAYSGHPQGKKERDFLYRLFQRNQTPHLFYISHYQQLNSITQAPEVFVIEKKR